jgi:hypothetical protein
MQKERRYEKSTGFAEHSSERSNIDDINRIMQRPSLDIGQRRKLRQKWRDSDDPSGRNLMVGDLFNLGRRVFQGRAATQSASIEHFPTCHEGGRRYRANLSHQRASSFSDCSLNLPATYAICHTAGCCQRYLD